MKKNYMITAALTLFASTTSFAGPVDGPFGVVSVRPYSNSPGIYLQVNSAALCGTEVFIIDSTLPNGKEMYAAVLTSIATGKKITLEAVSCTGWGTKLQSLWLNNG